ncbi:MAG: histidine phosphatase family protein [Acidimicrobiia bacterium]|nr:histidine phosphatase family protein [Acidimicrobiia bacterium]
MELLWIRHGQPGWVRDGLGVDDPDLTDLGRAQAERTGERLAGLEVDAVFVSPLRRAQQTAEPIVAALGLEPTTIDWLAEIRAPRFAGTPIEQVQRVFAEGRARPVDDHWDGLPGGESFRDFHRRVTSGVEILLSDHGVALQRDRPPLWAFENAPQRIVVVAHAGTNSVALGHLLGIEPVPWEWERFVSYHSSVSVLRPLDIGGAQAFGLHRFADTSHLPPDLQTF